MNCYNIVHMMHMNFESHLQCNKDVLHTVQTILGLKTMNCEKVTRLLVVWAMRDYNGMA